MDHVHAVRDEDDPIAWTNQHHIANVRDVVEERKTGASLGIPGRDRTRERRERIERGEE
jgi:hypothetical protein